MKTFLIILVCLLGLIVGIVLLAIILTPWMDRWGTIKKERTMVLIGDEYLIKPIRITTRAITIAAPPEKIYAWIVQTGADKSGMYSYTWLENLVGCTMAKDETIHPEWQNLKEGDLMHMCTSATAPPPYIVVHVIQDQAVVFGHKEKDDWVELWSFNLLPQSNGTTRLVSRTRTNMVGGFWEILRPISFTMERKMLKTIKNLSEK